MIEFLQQVINGLSLGAIYALIALGYTMIYGVLRFVNFAHGDVFMVGSYAGFYLAPLLIAGLAAEGAAKPPWTPPFAKNSLAGAICVLVAAMLICAALGIIIEKLAYRPLRSRPRLTVLITAIGVSIFLEYTGQFVFGVDPRYFPEILETHTVGNFPTERWHFLNLDDLGLAVTNVQLIVFVVTLLLLFALRIVVLNTRMGMAMRALSSNPTACSLMGVNNDVVVSFTFGLGSALAAAGGILYALMYPSIDPLMGVLVGLKAFVAAVLGGIGNIPGAALGGMLIGVVETMVVGYGEHIGIASSYRDGVAFAILILILLVKPTGLFGKSEREKV
ncbi:MAG: branched-chain amino acid transport system permease protein [Chthoniobacter sp.]|nr:branched-chain amino acid transport system permease protein [Chthoniobacter sp.]